MDEEEMSLMQGVLALLQNLEFNRISFLQGGIKSDI